MAYRNKDELTYKLTVITVHGRIEKENDGYHKRLLDRYKKMRSKKSLSEY